MEIRTLNNLSASGILPVRAQESHKGTFGRVLLICGSKRMVGCCSLAAEGALRSGAGLVTLAFPDVLYSSVTASLKECLFLPLPSDERGFISHLALSEILAEAERSEVIMIGCGIGVGDASKLIVDSLLGMEKPLIVDADGINCIALDTSCLKKARAEVLLTPHPGEMSRLTGLTVESIQRDRIKAVSDFTQEYNVNLLLKGHRTLIGKRGFMEAFVNTTGNSALAKGGSGDLLAGIAAGLTPSLKGDVFKAGVLSAYVHGMTADVLSAEMSEYSILPSDCASALPRIYKIIEMSGSDKI